MPIVLIVVFMIIGLGLAGGFLILALRTTELTRNLAGVRGELEAAQADRDSLRAGNAALVKQLQEAQVEDQKKVGWLDHQEREIAWLRSELEKRPKVTRKTYKVLTLGVKWTGKTSLTLKWANPLIDLGAIEGTKIERYERTVSQVVQKDVTIEHVFEIGDWGGEHIVDAQQELVVDEIHGLLIVVDLGGKDAKRVDPNRVQEQLREFQAEALRYFFGPRTVSSCKAVVLFINKSDLIPGTPQEVEEQAQRYYAPLIDNLMKYSTQVDVRVLVGSASYGHSTHMLFSHFVEKILPKNAYDTQLLQKMMSDGATTTMPFDGSGRRTPPPLPAAPHGGHNGPPPLPAAHHGHVGPNGPPPLPPKLHGRS
jgi:hypothetical protein